ncbi:MAG: carbohydrate ABC transporter permease [Halanaerobiales bacterium]
MDLNVSGKQTVRRSFYEYMSDTWLYIKKNKAPYLFLTPFTIVFLIFVIIPVLLSIVLSFTYFNMLQWPVWVGVDNYIRMFLEDDVFLIAVKNTLVFSAVTGPLSYLLCLLIAWLVNELQPKIRAFLTLLFYAPSIVGNAYLIWTVMFNGNVYGYANGLLLEYNIISEPIQWLIDPDWMMTIVIVVVLWMSLGTSFLVFIAGLQGIDPKLYEAGAIDGIRNRWQELWYITLPAMKGYMMFGAIMSITGSFAAAWQITALVGYPSTDYAVHTVMQHIEDYAFMRYEMGYASAIAVVLFVTMVLTQKIVQKILSKVGE